METLMFVFLKTYSILSTIVTIRYFKAVRQIHREEGIIPTFTVDVPFLIGVTLWVTGIWSWFL